MPENAEERSEAQRSRGFFGDGLVALVPARWIIATVEALSSVIPCTCAKRIREGVTAPSRAAGGRQALK